MTMKQKIEQEVLNPQESKKKNEKNNSKKKNKLKLKMKLCFLCGKSVQMLDKKLLSTMILIHKSKEGKKEDYFVIVDSLLSFKFSQERHYSSFDEMFENVCDLAYDVSNFLSSGGANIKTYLNDYEVVFDN